VPLYSSHLHLRPWNSNFLSTQVMLPGTVPNLQIQKCLGHILASSSVDHTSRACMHPHAPGLALFSSLTTISATLSSRFRIPDDDVTVNWTSVQVFFLERVPSGTKRSGPLDWDSRPRPRSFTDSIFAQGAHRRSQRWRRPLQSRTPLSITEHC
jgi:hypothetical protein